MVIFLFEQWMTHVSFQKTFATHVVIIAILKIKVVSITASPLYGNIETNAGSSCLENSYKKEGELAQRFSNFFLMCKTHAPGVA